MSDYKDFTKDFTLDSFVSLIITESCLTSFFATHPDFSAQEILLIQNLQNYGVTLKDVKRELELKDFTNQFKDKEVLEEIMRAIRVRWDYVIKYRNELKQYGDY